MIILQDVLNDDEVAEFREKLAGMNFVDGKLTAKGSAAARKHNLQMDDKSDGGVAMGKAVIDALVRHPVFSLCAIPKRVLAPMFSRYTSGMHYGLHVDSPFMTTPEATVRTDLAMTLFLSEPATYEGGELVVQTNGGDIGIKLDAGDAIIYNAGTLHQVNVVTSGERLAAVTWLESRVRDPQLREQIYDLTVARDHLTNREPDAPEIEMIDKVYVNLLRMWGE